MCVYIAFNECGVIRGSEFVCISTYVLYDKVRVYILFCVYMEEKKRIIIIFIRDSKDHVRSIVEFVLSMKILEC